jgi:hypothetical protein
MSENTVLSAIRLASVIHGIATVLDAENVRSAQPVTA